MKKVYILLISVTVLTLGLVHDGFAQSIRKPWREMTATERADYVNAINALAANIPQTLSSEHQRMAFLFGPNTHIHNSNIFLPWHRVFIYYFEQRLKAINPEISLPYWDWTDDWAASSVLFLNSSGGSTGLLGRNVNGNVWRHPTEGRAFRRGFGSFSQPTQQRLNTLVSNSNFTNFTNELELNPHNIGHAYIGGDMNSMFSPIDPIFYLHHAMVDKLWNDWAERHWNGGSLPFSNDADPNANMLTFIGYNGSTNANNVVRVNPNDWINSRRTKVWYAENGQVALSNYLVSGSENYRYTGVINAENSFNVGSGTNCVMVSAREIVLKPGFNSFNGSNFTARIDASSFNSRTSQDLAAKGKRQGWEDPELIEDDNQSVDLTVYPNPSTGQVTVSLPMMESSPYYDPETDDVFQLNVYNTNGQLIRSSVLSEVSQFELDLSTQPQGYYLIKVTSGLTGTSFTKRLALQ